MVSKTLIDAVLAFVNAPTWLDKKSIVEKYHELLLSTEADAVLEAAIAHNRNIPARLQLLEDCRTILQDCRAIGVDAAFVFPIGLTPGLMEALKDLLGADSPSSAHSTVVEHADLLLTDEADWTLIALASDSPEKPLFVERIAQRRDLLARCRSESTEAAFAEIVALKGSRHL